jgi:O-antigen/teichoic acid export membrane protein
MLMFNRGFWADRRILSKAALALVAKAVSAGLGILFSVALVREVGADGAGRFFSAYAIVLMLSVFCRFGGSNQILYEVAPIIDLPESKSILGCIAANTIILSLVASILLCMFSGQLARVVFGDDCLEAYIRWSSVAIMPYSLTFLSSSLNLAGGRVVTAVATQNLIIYGFMLLGFCLRDGWNGYSIFLAFGFGAVASLVLSLLRYWRDQRFIGVRRFVPSARVMRRGRDYLFADISFAMSNWLPLLFVAVVFPPWETGLFSVASRIAWFLSFLLVSVNAAVAPEFSRMFRRGDGNAVRALYVKCIGMISCFTIPVFFLGVAFSEGIVGIYGSGLEDAAVLLQILFVGQLVNACTGPIGYVLMMSGNARYVNASNAYALGVGLISMGILAALFGVSGATIGASVTMASSNVFMVCAAFRIGVFANDATICGQSV